MLLRNFGHRLVQFSLFFTVLAAAQLAQAQTEPAVNSGPMVEKFLLAGDLKGGRTALETKLAAQPEDDQARFELGALEVFQAVESLGQALHRYGLKPTNPNIPFVRLPVPENPKPEAIDYAKFRGVIQAFADQLTEADETLAKIDDKNVRLKLRLGLVRLDLDGDGRATDDELFWKVFQKVAFGGREIDPTELPKDFDPAFPIGFDYADVHWLRGYTHLLRAMSEAYLAHDSEAFFNATAPQFFAGAKSIEPKIDRGDVRSWEDEIADAILAIHLAHFKVIDPKRMEAAQRHLLEMVKQSRLCMDAIEAEMDDDREWIPNPKQTSLLPDMNLTRERIEGWREFLNEWEAILTGKKLVPHWRLAMPKRGINFQRVFTEPRDFDLVMWVHGVGALPYFEEGEVTDQETWQRLQRTFGGNFLGFAVWVN